MTDELPIVLVHGFGDGLAEAKQVFSKCGELVRVRDGPASISSIRVCQLAKSGVITH
jgi:hypothetical protein